MFNIHHPNVNSSLVCVPNYFKLVHTAHSTPQIAASLPCYILQQSLRNFNHFVTNNHCCIVMTFLVRECYGSPKKHEF